MELYNRAYKLDPEIDRHIDHEQVASEISQRDLAEIEPYYNPFRKLMMQNEPIDRDLFLSIIKSKRESFFEREPSPSSSRVFSLTLKDDKVNLLKDLPGDVLDKILGYLGWMNLPSLEIASRASRDLFLACRQESLWKYLHEKFTGAPANSIDNSWRLTFIMAPIFRTDGLYISKITYLRQGYQESAICQPSHLVTYYRYLRFFNTPEIKGRLVVALVSTEQPKNVLEKLRQLDGRTVKDVKERMFACETRGSGFKQDVPRSRNKEMEAQHSQANLFLGTFKFEAGRRYKLLLFDAHSKHPMRLKMMLELGDPLKGIPPHRLAKCFEYCGRVEKTTSEAETIEFDTHNWGKFYFSPVKSYK